MTNTTALEKHLSSSAGQSTSLSLCERVNQLAALNTQNLLLLDTSGSMSSDVNPNETKIDILWSIVQRLRGEGVQFRVCEFGADIHWSDAIVQPRPSGSTPLAEALEFVRSVNPKQITIITDGYPDDPQAALDSASTLGCIINCLYVGPADDMRARGFCLQLAEANHGRYGLHDLSTEALQVQAGDTARLMLTEGLQATHRRSVINL